MAERLENLVGVLSSITTLEEYKLEYEKGVNNAIVKLHSHKYDDDISVLDIHNTIFKSIYTYAGQFAHRQMQYGGWSFGSLPENFKKELELLRKNSQTVLKTNDPKKYLLACVYEHLKIVACHFFTDGNTRTSTLLLLKRLEKFTGGKPVPFTKIENDDEYGSIRKQTIQSLNPNMVPMMNYLLENMGFEKLKEDFIPSPFSLQILQENGSREKLLENVHTLNSNKNLWLYNLSQDTIESFVDNELELDHSKKIELSEYISQVQPQYLSIKNTKNHIKNMVLIIGKEPKPLLFKKKNKKLFQDKVSKIQKELVEFVFANTNQIHIN